MNRYLVNGAGIAVLWILFPPLIAGCTDGRKPADPPLTLTGPTMGTFYTVKLAGLPESIDGEELQDGIDRTLETVNDQMSTYRPESELSRFNRSTGTDWFEVSPATAHVVAEALRIGELSGGAFDVTVGPLVNLWNFGPESRDGEVPAQAEIDEALARVGDQYLEVRESPPALRKTRDDVYVDLSGIAKGFGTDQVAAYLDRRGISDYMIEVGGEVRTRGTRADGSPWRIGIERPLAGLAGVQKAVVLGDRALATSGDYRQFFMHEGRRFSHTIDPRTGWPVDHQLTSASVVAENAMSADALATALMVLGPDQGYNWAIGQNLAAFFIVRDEDRFVEQATPAFEQLLLEIEAEDARSKMNVFLIALAVFALAMLLMAVGVLVSNRRIRGSCGGLAGLRDDRGRPMCDACSTPAEDCTGENREALSDAENSGNTEPEAKPKEETSAP